MPDISIQELLNQPLRKCKLKDPLLMQNNTCSFCIEAQGMLHCCYDVINIRVIEFLERCPKYGRRKGGGGYR